MSFFVPSVHMGRSRPLDPDDPLAGRLPFGATRRRPKRKKTPIPWTCNIPYMCRIVLVSLSGFLVLLGGVAMSVLGYYPAYFSRETVFNGTSVVIVENSVTFYYIRNFSFVGPILMGIGCFAMMTAGVIYFEFRDKYFRDLPQNEIKSMPRQDVRNLLVDQFRHNYFRGIPIPLIFPSDSEKSEKEADIPTKETPPIVPGSPVTRKGSSVSMGNSLAPMFSTDFPELHRAYSTSTVPSLHPAVILSPLNLFQDESRNSSAVLDLNESGFDRGSLINMFKLAPSSLSRRSSTTGVENPAYLSDDDSEESLAGQLDGPHGVYGGMCHPSGSPSPVDGQFSSVIVHAASIHFPPDLNDVSNISTLQKCKSLQSNTHSDTDTPNLNVFSEYTNKSCPVFREIHGYSDKPRHWNLDQSSDVEKGSDRKSGKKRRRAKKSRKHQREECAMAKVLCESSVGQADVLYKSAEDASFAKIQQYYNEACNLSGGVETQTDNEFQHASMHEMERAGYRANSADVTLWPDATPTSEGKPPSGVNVLSPHDSERRLSGATAEFDVRRGNNVTPVPSVRRDSNVTLVSNVRHDSSVTPVSNVRHDSSVTPVSNVRRGSNVTPVSNVRHDSSVTPVSSVRRDSNVTPVSNMRRDSNVTTVSTVRRGSNVISPVNLTPDERGNITPDTSVIRCTKETSDAVVTGAVSVSPMPLRKRGDSTSGSHRDNLYNESPCSGGQDLPGTVTHIGSG